MTTQSSKPMNTMTRLIATSFLTAILSGCGGPDDFTPTENMTAADIYNGACQACHGANGGGKFGFLFQIAGTESSMEEIAGLLKDGGHIMPSFPNLSDEERMIMAAYIKAL
ncbi:MAG: c-type cytochrome [Gammaproteobacteria bacterium]|nr:c-type cytochrome [Gammaproteobacteria bacterium]